MRLNNLSARLKVNKWFVENGEKPISGELSYIAFATELRKRIAPRQVQCDFVLRSDAVRYVREMATQLKTGASK